MGDLMSGSPPDRLQSTGGQSGPHSLHYHPTILMEGISFKPSLAEEQILYEAIYRHVEHLWCVQSYSSDTILAAKMAADLFPQLGYPVPHWMTELGESSGS